MNCLQNSVNFFEIINQVMNFQYKIKRKYINQTKILQIFYNFEQFLFIIPKQRSGETKEDMNDPLITTNRKQSLQFEEVNQLFQRVFDPQNFTIAGGIKQLKQFGGITSVMSLLQASHREGLSSYADNRERTKVFGENVSPKGQNIIRKAIENQRDFTINLLFYIITLRFFMKLLFIRDGITVESIWDEIVSFVLLIVMISLKAMVNLEFFKLDQNEKKYYDENWVKVRRDGEILQTMQKCLLVGDIAIFNADDHIRIDGIILSVNDFYVSQSQTILKQESKKKSSILNLKQNEQNQNYDPFLLSGSTVLYGSAQVLICRIGQSCTFRLAQSQFSPFSTEVTPLIHNLKKVLNYVQKLSNIIAFISSGYFGLYFLHDGIVNNTLSWFTFLEILKKCSSLLGFVCLLQKLKIVRSLQFYLQSFRSDKYFRIKNKCTLQRLNEVDLFIIQKDAIRINNTQRGYIIPKIGFLSFLNQQFKLKIISKQNKIKLMQEFDCHTDENDNNGLIFQTQRQNLFYDENYINRQAVNSNNNNNIASNSTQEKLKRLRQCVFIPECNRKKLQTEFMPILEGLEYNIVYIYKVRPNEERVKCSNNVLTIAFSEEQGDKVGYNNVGIGNNSIGSYKHIGSSCNINLYNKSLPQSSTTLGSPQTNCSQQQWIHIKNTPIAQQQLREIIFKSVRFSQLYNVYMVQFVNNIVIFFFLSWISIYRTYSIDFYWSLTIIIIARFIFFRIYRMIALDTTQPKYESRSHRRIIKLNIYLFFYYLYVLNNLEEKINVVLFFVCNTMLRTEIMLIRVQRQLSVKNIFKNNLLVLTLLSCYLAFRILNHFQYKEELMLLQYVLGLSFLLIVYGFVH